jgi:hypothetical protein
MKESADTQLKVYADSLNNRLERKGTITGVEFLPEDKTNLLAEWKIIEDDINYEIQSKLLSFLDNDIMNNLDELKADVKEFIEQQKPFSYKFNVKDESSDPAQIVDEEENKVLKHITSTGFALDTPITITKPYAFPDNTREPYFEFKIENGIVGYRFYNKIR